MSRCETSPTIKLVTYLLSIILVFYIELENSSNLTITINFSNYTTEILACGRHWCIQNSLLSKFHSIHLLQKEKWTFKVLRSRFVLCGTYIPIKWKQNSRWNMTALSVAIDTKERQWNSVIPRICFRAVWTTLTLEKLCHELDLSNVGNKKRITELSILEFFQSIF